MCSTCIGSAPITKSRKSSMQAIVAPALPSSVPSPHPTRPWLVSSFTKTYGRSEVGVRETPKTFMPVTLRPDCESAKASDPRKRRLAEQTSSRSRSRVMARSFAGASDRETSRPECQKVSTPHDISPVPIRSSLRQVRDLSAVREIRRVLIPDPARLSLRAFRGLPELPAPAHAG